MVFRSGKVRRSQKSLEFIKDAASKCQDIKKSFENLLRRSGPKWWTDISISRIIMGGKRNCTVVNSIQMTERENSCSAATEVHPQSKVPKS